MSQYKFGGVIKRLEVEKSTGTLVCVGEDNLFGRVYFVDGNPKAARCGDLQGMEALQLLDDARLVSVKFHDGAKLIKTDTDDKGIDGFETDDSEPVAGDVVDTGTISASEIDSMTDSTETNPRLEARLSAPLREVLSEELVEYVGPVAQMIVSGLEANITVMEALQLLAAEIGDRELARQFVEKVRQKI